MQARALTWIVVAVLGAACAETPRVDAAAQSEHRRSANATSTAVRTAPLVLGALAREDVDRVVQAHAPQTRGCYERALAKAPGLTVALKMKWVVGSDGRVAHAQVEETRAGNEDLESCLADEIRTWVFRDRTTPRSQAASSCAATTAASRSSATRSPSSARRSSLRRASPARDGAATKTARGLMLIALLTAAGLVFAFAFAALLARCGARSPKVPSTCERSMRNRALLRVDVAL